MMEFVSGDLLNSQLNGKIKAMFQTTNQLYDATNFVKGIDKWLIYDG